jgi:hypothetical protein
MEEGFCREKWKNGRIALYDVGGREKADQTKLGFSKKADSLYIKKTHEKFLL